MPLRTSEHNGLLRVAYDGSDVSDIGRLRDLLTAEASSDPPRGVVIEYAADAMIYSSEIGVIVQFLKSVHTRGVCLHLVIPPPVRAILQTMNLHKLPGIKLHELGEM